MKLALSVTVSRHVRCAALSTGLGLGLLLLDCGGAGPPIASAPPASAPVAAVVSVVPTATASAPVALPSAAALPSAEPPSSTSGQPTEQVRRESPIEILTARDVAFQVDYANSAARHQAEADCTKEAKGDPSARSAGLEQARDKFQPDVLRFTKDAQGKWALVIYKLRGSDLSEVYLGSVDFADQTPDSVRLKLTGRERGRRPLFKSGKNLIRVPNNYTVEIDDPGLGHLTYHAKVGLAAPQ
jgi:hypothetical protein